MTDVETRRTATTLRIVMTLAALATAGTAAACEVKLGQRDTDRLVAIALGAEYGSVIPQVVKWADDITIAVMGNPLEADKAALRAVVDDLGELIAPLRISIGEGDANVRIHFAPESEFLSILPQYQPVNMGYFWTWWSDALNIVEADVLISTTGLTQKERNHLIREEVTQMLGLMKDVLDDRDSIFYAEWTDTTEFTTSDRRVISALYCPDVVAGMVEAELRATLAP